MCAYVPWSWLGLPNPYWDHLFLKHANSNNMESMLIQTSMEYLHLKLGTSQNIFKLPDDAWKFLAMDCWLITLWRFVDFAKIYLQQANLCLQPLAKVMCHLWTWLCLQISHPKSFLQLIDVILLTMFISGLTWWMDRVPRFVLPSPRNHLPPNSHWKWPIECPSKANVLIWSSFLWDSPLTSSYHLVSTLGPWIHPTQHLDFIPVDPIHQMAYLTGHVSYWQVFQVEYQAFPIFSGLCEYSCQSSSHPGGEPQPPLQ